MHAADQEPSYGKRGTDVMLDAVTDRGVIQLDSTGKVVRWSAGAQALSGYSDTEVWAGLCRGFIPATIGPPGWPRVNWPQPKNPTVGRIGGDEMMVLLPGVQGIDEVMDIAEKIRHRAAEAFHLLGHTIHATVSIGATLAARGESVTTMTSRADTAMYRAKQAGRNTVTTL